MWQRWHSSWQVWHTAWLHHHSTPETASGQECTSSAEHWEHTGLFMGFSPGCQLLKLDDFHLHLPLLCQGSHVLNWRHPLQLQSLNQLMPPRPQQDVVANVPHVLQHTRHLPSVPPCPDPCTDPASPSPGCPFPQRNHDLGWSQALSNPHNKIMQTRCFSSLASPAWSV